MIGSADLLEPVPRARRTPPAARLRRLAAIAILLTSALAGGSAMRAIAWDDPSATAGSAASASAPSSEDVTPVAAPSDVLARALATPWRLVDLGLRTDDGVTASLTARFEAPPGRPALPARLLAALDDDAFDDLVATAVVATAGGTAVEVRGSVRIDLAPRPGDAVDPSVLPLHVADLVARSGALPQDVRSVPGGGGPPALAVSLSAGPPGAVAALAALEDGPSSPARVSTVRVRNEGDLLTVEIVLTGRLAPAPRPVTAMPDWTRAGGAL